MIEIFLLIVAFICIILILCCIELLNNRLQYLEQKLLNNENKETTDKTCIQK